MRAWANDVIATLTKWFALKKKKKKLHQLRFIEHLLCAQPFRSIISLIPHGNPLLSLCLFYGITDANMLSDLPKIKARSQTDSTFLTVIPYHAPKKWNPFIQAESGKCQPAHYSKTNDNKALIWAVLAASKHWPTDGGQPLRSRAPEQQRRSGVIWALFK